MLRRLLMAAALLSLGSTAALAGPFYAGANASRTTFKINDFGGSFDTTATGQRVFAGYRFLKFFGLEAGYVDFGSLQDSSAGVDLKVDATEYDLSAIGVLPLPGRFELSARAGVFRWDRTLRATGAVTGRDSSTGTDAVYGVGAAFLPIKHLAIRVDYQEFHMQDVDHLTQWSAGIDLRL